MRERNGHPNVSPTDRFREKILDADGTRVQVLRNGKVVLIPPEGVACPPVTWSTEEFSAMAQFVRWCWQDLRKGEVRSD